MLDQGIKVDSNCASRAIGYRQALLALEHWHAHPEDITAAQLVRSYFLMVPVQLQMLSMCCQQRMFRRSRTLDTAQAQTGVV